MTISRETPNAPASRVRWVLCSVALLVACTPSETDAHPGDPAREFRAIAERLEASHDAYVGRGQIPAIRTALAAAGGPSIETADDHRELAHHLLRLGQVDKALASAEKGRKIAERLRRKAPGTPELETVRKKLRVLEAQAHLRRAEVENCIARHNRDCCIFPLANGGVHVNGEPARRALDIYLALAREEPEDLSFRWLANLLAMALGEHPDALPPEIVIPDAAFDSELDIGRFPDVAASVGVDVFSQCGGSAVDDFDGDGLLDIAVSSFDPRGPLTLLFNGADGRFEDRSERAGVRDQLGGLNLVSADYDSDGDADLLVLRGAWLLGEGRIRNSLLRNAGNGSFEDVTRAAGVAEPESPTQTAVFGDLDGDGDVDLYVGNEAVRDADGTHVALPSELFLNDGDGTFTLSDQAKNERYCKGVTAGDHDNDGDLDLYVSNIGNYENLGVNRLYANDGNAVFRDVAVAAGVHRPRWSFATWFFDQDNDGWLDLFVAGYDATLGDVAASYLGLEDTATRPHLYRNRGDGTFRDVAPRVGLDRPFLPMGANFGDLDNDGWLDVYLTTGNPRYETLMPNVALRNDGGRRFQDVTRSSGLGHLQKGHGVTFADVDNDGDQDIHHELGGFYPGDGFANALFENPGHGNRFLFVELVGTTSNKGGIGTRIRVRVEGANGERDIHRAAGSVSSFGGAPRRLEIGLGAAERVVFLDVRWPAPGTLQRFEEVPLDALVRVTEGEEELERLELRAVALD